MEQTKKLNIKEAVNSLGVRLSLMIVILFLVSCIMTPSYFSFQHVMSILVLSCFLGMITIGQTFIILTGGADLSVSYSVTLAGCVFAQVTKDTNSMFAGIAAALLTGVVIGLLKGFGVAVLKIPSMVMTLATGSILMSCTYLYTNGVLKGQSTPFITAIAKGSIFGWRYCVLFWFALGALAIFVLKKTAFGRSVYAIGTNIRVAQLSGINTTKVLLGVYVYASVMMAVCGIVLIGYLGYPNYTMADGYQLISIAAVVIGGTSILGGQGGYLGTMGGVVIIYLIQSVLITMNIAEAGKDIIYGLVILAILLAYGRGKKTTG